MAGKHKILSLLWLFVWCCLWIGCAPTQGDVVRQGEPREPKISYDVAKESTVTNFKCYVGEYNKEKTLIHKITVKNVSNKNHRYRIMIAIPDGDAVGGLLPASPKEKFEPGKEKSAEYPVIGINQIPEKLEVSVILMD